tara:strand:- start:155 stop:382 length:228 start_codon:yes stop_codon:yes gene_type:complete
LEKDTCSSYDARHFPPTAPHTVYLKHLYIATNPSPLGQKANLGHPGDASEYSKVHKKYHKTLKSYREKFEFIIFF